MKNNASCFRYVNDADCLDKSLLYFSSLRPLLPSQRLKDCCSGISVLIFELSHFLDKHPEYHGNY